MGCSRGRTLAIVAVLAGCGRDVTLPITPAEVVARPELVDFGVSAVGEAATQEVVLRVTNGADLTLHRVDVVNVEGMAFFLEGDPPTRLRSRDAEVTVSVAWRPMDQGYHWGTLEFAHDGANAPTVVHLRGQAVLPDTRFTPGGLDFGQVDPGGVASRPVTVSNRSDLDVTISDYQSSDATFSLLNELPVVVPAGRDFVFGVAFRPVDTSPRFGSLTFNAGSEDLPQVTLRGNDCEHGDPAEYDRDLDGVTSCAGDCDDTSELRRPGATELANALDDDCDGDTDEGTPWADDDRDGYCEDPAFCSDGAMPGDCADSADPGADTDRLNPGETEIPGNGLDDDCDGVVT